MHPEALQSDQENNSNSSNNNENTPIRSPSVEEKSARKVHFSKDESNDDNSPNSVNVQLHLFQRDYNTKEDKAVIWYTEDEIAARREDNEEGYRDHRENPASGVEQKLQEMWDLCAKNSMIRSPGRTATAGGYGSTAGPYGRRSTGRESHTYIEPIDASAFLLLDEESNSSNPCETLSDESDSAANTHSVWETRGLEGAIFPSIHVKRVQMKEGILNAQKNLSKSHPTMRERTLCRTAVHLSRASATFAKAMADQDAIIAAQYYDGDLDTNAASNDSMLQQETDKQ